VRVVGLDLGVRRIGVAVSDSGGSVATPHAVLERSGNDVADRATIAAVVRDLGAAKVVVGLPLSLDGSRGPAAVQAVDEAGALEQSIGIPVELHDERLTTVEASRAPRGKGRRRTRQVVDDAAATLILQSWLDVHRVRG
jgi:putative Holliday junction resolvase